MTRAAKHKAAEALSTSDWAVLACLAEIPVHGFGLASVFSKTGELGGAWHIQRPQVYRALGHLETQGLAVALRREAGGGPRRTLYRPTERGDQVVRDWLSAPVAHLREGRNDLLLKLVFLERRGCDPGPLLEAQRERFSGVLHVYQARLATAAGAEKIALEWRLETAWAGLRFLEARLAKR